MNPLSPKEQRYQRNRLRSLPHRLVYHTDRKPKLSELPVLRFVECAPDVDPVMSKFKKRNLLGEIPWKLVIGGMLVKHLDMDKETVDLNKPGEQQLNERTINEPLDGLL